MKPGWIKARTLLALRPVRWPQARNAKIGYDCWIVLMHSRLSASAKITWCALSGLENPSGVPTAQQIAEYTGQAVEAVVQDFRELEAAGYMRSRSRSCGKTACLPARRPYRRSVVVFP